MLLDLFIAKFVLDLHDFIYKYIYNFWIILKFTLICTILLCLSIKLMWGLMILLLIIKRNSQRYILRSNFLSLLYKIRF